MSDYLKNAKYIHVATEILYACVMTYYVFSKNKQMNARIEKLESVIYHYEQIINEHEKMLQMLLNNKVSKKQQLEEKFNTTHVSSNSTKKPIQQTVLIMSPPKTNTYTPARIEEEVVEEIVEEVVEESEEEIETQGGYEENLDEEIQNELNKLKLLKDEL